VRRLAFIGGALAATASFPISAAAVIAPVLELRLVTDESDAVLRILGARATGAPTDADWQALFSSEGYRRLVAREASFRRPIDETSFRAFVTSDELVARRAALGDTLQRWSHADVTECGRRALAYLPAGSHMRAAVYPEIKPQPNSFVFDLEHDPGIFLYLNPDVGEAEFTYTVAHELHHVGFAQNCPTPAVKREIDALPPRLKVFENWLGSFGEGFAVLAGAGGPAVNPATVVYASAAGEWLTERETFASRIDALTTFFRAILNGQLKDDDAIKAGMTFFGNQGPWYTVGWRMAVTIELNLGRARLVECIADNRRFLPTYNNVAARSGLPLWPNDLAHAFGLIDT
jgi:hypothetical protein